MKQVQNVNLNKLRTDELFGFFEVVVDTTSLVKVQADQPVISAFKNAVTAFDEVLKQNASSEEVKTRQEADVIADDTWRGLKLQADAMSRFPEPTTQAIAIKANAIIDKYGVLNKMSYDEEYANMKGLLEELKAMPDADLTKIGLKIWVDALGVAYDDYMKATLSKNQSEGEKVVGIVKQRRGEAEDAYHDLVFRINCGAGYNGDEPYAEFIDTLNAQIDGRKATLASRQTISAKKNEKEDSNKTAQTQTEEE